MEHMDSKEIIRSIPSSAWRRASNHQYAIRDGKEIAVQSLFDGTKVFVVISNRGRKDEWFTCDRSELFASANPLK
jgi:hypothetical protein